MEKGSRLKFHPLPITHQMHLGRYPHLFDQFNRRSDKIMRAVGWDKVFWIQKGYQFAMILPAAVAGCVNILEDAHAFLFQFRFQPLSVFDINRRGNGLAGENNMITLVEFERQNVIGDF